jgi:hypothetical protein
MEKGAGDLVSTFHNFTCGRSPNRAGLTPGIYQPSGTRPLWAADAFLEIENQQCLGITDMLICHTLLPVLMAKERKALLSAMWRTGQQRTHP